MPKFQPWEYASPTSIRATKVTTNPKKMTGTRLGKILGLDSWGTAFQAWCEICRVAEEPFEGNKYTAAGNALEPKIIEWCKENVSPYVYTPEEFYNVSDAKKAMRYDFFPTQPILGGMWDAIVLDGPLGKGKPLGYVEAKTSSRPQDWVDGPPLKYCVQGLLYGHLDNLPRVFIPVRFMEPHEYERPQDCECTDDNTFIYELNTETTEIVDGDTIAYCVQTALEWYQTHVVDNISPDFDEKTDKKFLDILRKSEVQSDGLEALAKEASVLEAKIEAAIAKSGVADLEKQIKKVKASMKPMMVELFQLPEHKNDTVVAAYKWQVKKAEEEYIDKEAMAEDGVLTKYTKTRDKFTMTKEKN